MTITLPVELLGRVQRAVATGDYGSADDAISAALLEWEDRRGPLRYAPETLRSLVEKGSSSGPSPYPSIEDVKAEARRRWTLREL